MASYLLDTNTCIALMRGHPKTVQRMAAVPPGECAISTITAYELFTGVEKCSQPAQERAKVDLLLQTVHEIETANTREFSRVRACTWRIGKRDDRVLLTLDRGDFGAALAARSLACQS